MPKLRYISKRTCGQVLVLLSRRLVRSEADGHFVHVETYVWTGACIVKPTSSSSRS